MLLVVFYGEGKAYGCRGCEAWQVDGLLGGGLPLVGEGGFPGEVLVDGVVEPGGDVSRGGDRGGLPVYDAGVPGDEDDVDDGRKTTRGDFHYNGLSDVIYVRKEANGIRLEYGLNGVNDLQDIMM